jgi:phosphonatase-like hydrolase
MTPRLAIAQEEKQVDIKLVVFDMAGTTVNDENGVNSCLRASLAAAGVVVSPTQVNAVMGLPKPTAIAALLREVEGQSGASDRVESIHRDFVDRSIAFYRRDPSVHEVPGAGRVFEMLRGAGIKVALDTGFSRSIAQVILDRLGWSEGVLIDGSICSDEVERGRPHADMVRELMRRLEVFDARQVAKVGDTPADLEEGHRAGCGLVIGVTGGTHSRAELDAYPHTHLIETVANLPSVLGLDGA